MDSETPRDCDPVVTHELAPNGDTILVLNNPNAPFAELPTFRWSLQDEDAEKPAKPIPIVFQLSSAHLILASEYFQKALQPPWSESKAQPNGQLTIEATDWDEQAFLTLMNIIHGRPSKVPRTLSLEDLAKMAALVDYYQCHEVVQLFAELWMGASDEISRSCDRELVLQMACQSVFCPDDTSKLNKMARVFIQSAVAPFNSLSLPISPHLIDQMNDLRVRAIRKFLEDLLEFFGLLSGSVISHHWCGSDVCAKLLLGNITSAMQKRGLLSTLLNPRNDTFSFLACNTMTWLVREFELPNWYDYDALKQMRESAFKAGYKTCWDEEMESLRPNRRAHHTDSSFDVCLTKAWTNSRLTKVILPHSCKYKDVLAGFIKSMNQIGDEIMSYST